MKSYTKCKFRKWLNKKLTKKHYITIKSKGRYYQIEYHHFYFVAYYDKPSIKELIRCLKNNHYIVYDLFEDYDFVNDKGSKCSIEKSCFEGFTNKKRKYEAQKILNAKVKFWQNLGSGE